MYLKIESALSMCAKLALAKRKARTGPVELFGRLILANPPRGSDSVVAPARVARVEAVRGVVVAVAVDGRALAARPRQDVVDVREVVLGRVLRRPRLTGFSSTRTATASSQACSSRALASKEVATPYICVAASS